MINEQEKRKLIGKLVKALIFLSLNIFSLVNINCSGLPIFILDNIWKEETLGET
jgi:hypothetical protein